MIFWDGHGNGNKRGEEKGTLFFPPGKEREKRQQKALIATWKRPCVRFRWYIFRVTIYMLQSYMLYGKIIAILDCHDWKSGTQASALRVGVKCSILFITLFLRHVIDQYIIHARSLFSFLFRNYYMVPCWLTGRCNLSILCYPVIFFIRILWVARKKHIDQCKPQKKKKTTTYKEAFLLRRIFRFQKS